MVFYMENESVDFYFHTFHTFTFYFILFTFHTFVKSIKYFYKRKLKMNL